MLAALSSDTACFYTASGDGFGFNIVNCHFHVDMRCMYEMDVPLHPLGMLTDKIELMAVF